MGICYSVNEENKNVSNKERNDSKQNENNISPTNNNILNGNNNKNKNDNIQSNFNIIQNNDSFNDETPIGASNLKTSKFVNTPINKLKQSEIMRQKEISKSELQIEAIVGEKEYSLYIRKGEKIKVEVDKNNNKWCFKEEDEDYTYKGDPNEQYDTHNIGCLKFRIKYEVYYIDTSPFEFVSKSEGSLLISANLNPIDYPIYSPSGIIKVTIEGGKQLKETEIDERTGYEIKELSSTPIPIEHDSINFDLEMQIFRYINKARKNINKFLEDFVLFYHNESSEEFLELKTNYSTPLNELQYKEELMLSAKAHCKYLCDKKTKGKSNIKQRITKFLKNVDICGENVIMSHDNALLLVDSMILDDNDRERQNRNNILNPNYKYIGISINKHPTYKYCCVIDFCN